MTRTEYLAALERALRPLTLKSEREEILRYYEEYFDEAGAEGEAAVAEQLGDPRALARATALERTDEPRRGLSRLRELPVVGKLFRVSLRSRRLWAGAALALLLVCALGTAAWCLRPVRTYTAPRGLDVPAFTSVEVDTVYASVTVQQGVGYRVELLWDPEIENELRCGVRDGVLHISGGPLKETAAPSALNCQVKITVPYTLDLNRENGRSFATELDRVAVKTAVGNVTVHDLDCKKLSVSTGNGTVSIQRGKVWEKLDAFTGRGRLTYSGIPAPESDLRSDLGGVDLTLLCPQEASSYTFRVEKAGEGRVYLNGEDRGYQIAVTADPEQYRVKAASTSGDIRATFAYPLNIKTN